MSPDRTPAERLADALTACHDAAYTEAFRAGLDAVDRFASEIVGDRKPTSRQAIAIRNAYLVLANASRVAAQPPLRHGRYEAALISNVCAEDLKAMAKARCEETLTRLGGAK